MKKQTHTNRLISETSPYLLQHTHNPVDWFPWGEEAFSRARAEDRLVVISIGYSACHWCHVMEHESFSDQEVAALMNEKFVSIKVDREERPDVDSVYMSAVQLISGSGGWPLNVIALPDGRPLFGGTYFRKEQWLNVLTLVSDYYIKNRERTLEHAASLTEGIKSAEKSELKENEPEFSTGLIDEFAAGILESADRSYGGFNGAPKFPLPAAWKFMLHYHGIQGSKDALDSVILTLDRMASGGIYDHIGGGFARYSTDERWHIPHFEKMLYDNAQLVSLYSQAFQATKKELYRQVVYSTINFVENELISPDGLFYSSIDADSEGEEGRFYAWTSEQVDKILGKDSGPVSDYFGITPDGNWEKGLNILYKPYRREDFTKKRNITAEELDKMLAQSAGKLLAERNKRPRPGLDYKVIASWNALIIKGYTDAYRAFGEERFLARAIKCAGMLLENLRKPGGGISRCFTSGKAAINGFLDDYAFTIDAFIALYQATFNEAWISEAEILAGYADKHFSDSGSGMFCYTSDEDPPLAARTSEITDNVIPSSNSMMAINLFNLARYTGNDAYDLRARKMTCNIISDARRGGPYYANWDILASMISHSPAEIVIMGNDWREKLREFDDHYLPGVLFAGGSSAGRLPLTRNRLVEGKTLIYVCRNRSCMLPVEKTTEALRLITGKP